MPMRKIFPSSFIQYSKILDVPLSQRSLKLFFLFSNTTFVTLIYYTIIVRDIYKLTGNTFKSSFTLISCFKVFTIKQRY